MADKDTLKPEGCSAVTGFRSPPIDVMPTAAGSARVSSNSRSRSGASSARVPTNRSEVKAASINARSSRSPSISTSMIFAALGNALRPSAPVAISPAAVPATVASSRLGNTLFVPVDKGISTASRQPSVKARLVPSPPRTNTAVQPVSRSARAAAMVSNALPWACTSTALALILGLLVSLRSSSAVAVMPCLSLK